MKVEEEIRALTDEEIQVLQINKSGARYLLGREYRYSDAQRTEFVRSGGDLVRREDILPEKNDVGWIECATRVRDLPFRWTGYTSVDCVVWEEDSMADLAPAQLEALSQFVETGGTLIFYTGKDWSQGIGSVEKFLPVESPTVVDAGSSVLCIGDAKEGTFLLNGLGIGGHPLIYEMQYGMGTVCMLAFPFDSKLGKKTRGDRSLWTSLLGPSALLCRREPGTEHNKRIESVFREHQRLSIPRRTTVGWFFGIYVFLLVPANYALCRFLQRTIYAWCFCPVIAVLFTVGAYRYDSPSGADVQMQLRNVVHLSPNSEVVEVVSYISLFSAYTRSYEVEVDEADFAFNILELRVGVQDKYSNTELLYQSKTETLKISGRGAGSISELNISARSRKTVVGTGLLPLNTRPRQAFELSRAQDTTLPSPAAFGVTAEARVYEGPFLPVKINGKRLKPESERTIFLIRRLYSE